MLTHFSIGSVMYGISFHVESPIRPTCRLVLLGSSPNALRSLSILCASQHLRETRVVPQFDSCRSTDGRCSAQVGSPSSRSACGLTKRCGFPQTCLARRPSPLRRAAIVSLLGALSPCPTVDEAVCPRQSSTLPSPSPVHKRPIASPLCNSLRVLHRTMCGISPLSPSLLPVVSKPCFRLERRRSSEAFLARSPCCCCFLALCLLWTVASAGPHQLVCGCSCPSSRVRFWVLARWGYDTFPGDSVSFWARHPSLFLPSSTVPLFNSANLIRARVGLVGESLLVFPALSGAAHPLAGRRPLSVPSSPMPEGSSTLAVVVPFLYLPFSYSGAPAAYLHPVKGLHNTRCVSDLVVFRGSCAGFFKAGCVVRCTEDV